MTIRWATLLLALSSAIESISGDTNSIQSPYDYPHAPTNFIAGDTDRYFEQRHWRREHGLPSDEVRGVYQTRDGYLWVGTSAGLARFDGQRFTVFNRANTMGMTDELIHGIVEDTAGRLWVATENNLIVRIGGAFKSLVGLAGIAVGRPVPIASDRHGNVWLNGNEGFWRWRDGTETRVQGTHPRGVSAAAVDPSGRLWVQDLNEEKLLRYDHNDIPDSVRLPSLPELRGSPVFAFRPDGSLWALSPRRDGRTIRGHLGIDHALLRLGERNWIAMTEAWFHNGGRGVFLTFDVDGRVWLPCGDEHAVFSFHNGRLTRWPVSGMAADDFVRCAFSDHEGNIWFGFEKSGLQCWRPHRIQTMTRADGLPDDATQTVCEARDGSIWIGTDGGASRFRDGQITNYSEAQGLSRKQARSIVEDTEGAIWIGTLNGLNVLRDGRIEQQHHFPGEWFNTKVRALHVSRDGALWVGTVQGLHRLHGGQRQEFTVKDGLAHQEVLAIREDSAAGLWIGTAGGGLSVFRNGAFSRFSTTNGLSSNFVWAFHEDADGVVWIGTERGLSRHDHGRFFAFSARHGLPDDTVNQILEDHAGSLWFGGGHGIYRVHKRELNEVAAGRAQLLHCVAYDKGDGLPAPDTSGQRGQPAACKTRDGRLWFPTAHGVAIFDPKNLPDLTNAPPVVIEQIRANGQVIYDNGPGVVDPSASPKAPITSLEPPIRLAPGTAHILEVQFTANTFVSPEKVQFKYRMEGVDKRWIDAGGTRKAYYANLRAGDYRFQVVARNKYGVEDEAGASFAFNYAPHYYQAWWFRTSGALAGLTFLIWNIHRRLRGFRARIRLQAEVRLADEREHLARDLHDGLGADLARLQRLAEKAERDVTAPQAVDVLLHEFADSARESARRFRDALWATHPTDPTLDGLAARLQTEAEDILRPVGVRCRFEMPSDLPRLELTPIMRRELLLFTREALTNIVRHAAASEATLRLVMGDGQLVLEIRDDGCGFDLPEGPTLSGTKGLTNLQVRGAAMRGKVLINSTRGTGTTVRLTVPLAAQLKGFLFH